MWGVYNFGNHELMFKNKELGKLKYLRKQHRSYFCGIRKEGTFSKEEYFLLTRVPSRTTDLFFFLALSTSM